MKDWDAEIDGNRLENGRQRIRREETGKERKSSTRAEEKTTCLNLRSGDEGKAEKNKDMQ